MFIEIAVDKLYSFTKVYNIPLENFFEVADV